jgi:hypothetical protein
VKVLNVTVILDCRTCLYPLCNEKKVDWKRVNDAIR